MALGNFPFARLEAPTKNLVNSGKRIGIPVGTAHDSRVELYFAPLRQFDRLKGTKYAILENRVY
jgi:hypothetical protein